MIKREMIAPCGLNCGICSAAFDEEKPCLGCRGPEENKYEFCRFKCKIWRCERLLITDGFCDQCPNYPCEDVVEKEGRYTTAYPVEESPIQNLKEIRELGIEAFLQRESVRRSCPVCGGIIIIHTGRCSKCGRLYEVKLGATPTEK